MLIKINGKEETVTSATTLAELITIKKLIPDHIMIEHNLQIVAREDLEKVLLRENDTVEIVSFVGGG